MTIRVICGALIGFLVGMFGGMAGIICFIVGMVWCFIVMSIAS